jgi:single-strand DNA-binding protein
VNDNKDKPLFITVEAYGAQAKPIVLYTQKGRQLAVTGRLEIDTWERDGVKRERAKVVANRVEFLDGKRSAEDVDADAALAAAREADDGIPF